MLEVKILKTCIRSNGASPSASTTPVRMRAGPTRSQLGSASPRRFDAAETSWPAGRSALDFTLVPFNDPAPDRVA